MRNRVVLIICCAVTCVGQAECSDGEDEKLSRCTASEDELKFCDLDTQEFPCEAGPAKTTRSESTRLNSSHVKRSRMPSSA